jgi:hypothetical protein
VAGEPRSYRLALGGTLALLAAILLWNVARYPPGGGYDAVDHISYADGIVHGRLPAHGTGEYYTPPLFYALAGSATWVGRRAGLGEPHRVAQLFDAGCLLATALLVLALARLLWPERRTLHIAAVAFLALLPVTVKTAAMFHPETLDLLLSTLALYLGARMLVRRSYRVPETVALGLVLGAGQLTRAFSLWTFGAVFLVLALVRQWRALAVVVAVTAAVAAPWYVHQAREYSSPVFDRPTQHKPLWERRPLGFYVDPGVPEVVTRPYRPSYRNRAIPTTYTEAWGDYFGIWVWNGNGSPGAAARRELRLQSLVGLLPSLLALVGWLLLLARSRRRPERLLVALLPALGILGYLYFTVSYPTRDGDVLKGTYLLTIAAPLALAFGYALDRLPRRALLAATALLVAGAVAELPFLLYG